MKKESKKEEKKLEINEITSLYEKYVRAEKEAKKAGETYKKMIVDYAKNNPDMFNGNTISLPNNIDVVRKETIKCEYNEDMIDTEWIDCFLLTSGGDAIKINLDAKMINKTYKEDKELRKCLSSIEYTQSFDSSFSVLLK